MEYTYENITHQVGRESADADGNGEDKVLETMFCHAICNKLVIRCDKNGVYFTIVNVDNNKVLARAHTKQITIKEVS